MSVLTDVFKKSTSYLNSAFQKSVDFVKDVYAAITEPKAMKPEQRTLDEFKLVAGGTIAGFGLLEVNPLTTAGGAIPAWESLHEMEQAGHKWRMHHPCSKK